MRYITTHEYRSTVCKHLKLLIFTFTKFTDYDNKVLSLAGHPCPLSTAYPYAPNGTADIDTSHLCQQECYHILSGWADWVLRTSVKFGRVEKGSRIK